MPGTEHRPDIASAPLRAAAAPLRAASALPFVLTLALALALVACGDSATDPATDPATQPGPTSPGVTPGEPGTSGATSPGAPSGEPQVIWTAQISDGGKAPIGLGSDGEVWVAGQRGTVHALDIEDGRELWSTTLDGTNETTAPIEYGDAVLIALSRVGNAPSDAPPPRLVALDRADGSQLWEIELEENPFMAPLWGRGGDTLYFGATGGIVYEIDLEDRSAEVLADVGSSVRTNLLPEMDAFLMGTQSGDAVAINVSGEELWRQDLGGIVLGSPALDAAGHAVFGTTAGEAVALDPATGDIAWRTELDGSVGAPLAVDASLTVVGSRTLAGLNPTDGSILWEIEDPVAFRDGLPGFMGLAPDGTIRLASTAGTVQARDREGELLWSWTSAGELRPGVHVTAEGDTLIANSAGVVARLR